MFSRGIGGEHWLEMGKITFKLEVLIQKRLSGICCRWFIP